MSQRRTVSSRARLTRNAKACFLPTRLGTPSCVTSIQPRQTPTVSSGQDAETTSGWPGASVTAWSETRSRVAPHGAAYGQADALEGDRLIALVGDREARVDVVADHARAVAQRDRALKLHETRTRARWLRRIRGQPRVGGVPAELGHEHLDVGDPVAGAVGAVLGRDGVDRVQAGAVIQRPGQPLRDAGDGLVPGAEVALRPRGAEEPVEGVVGALVAVQRVEELAEVRLRAGDSHEEGRVDAVLPALCHEGGAGAGHRRTLRRKEVVDLGGVGSRRGRRREDAGRGGQQHADEHEDEGERRCQSERDPHARGPFLADARSKYRRESRARRPEPLRARRRRAGAPGPVRRCRSPAPGRRARNRPPGEVR